MLRLLFVALMVLIANPIFAKTEDPTSIVPPVSAYGTYNGAIVPLKVAADGTVVTNASTATGWTKSGTNVILSTISDNVGIGTATPTSKLAVVGNVLLTNNSAYRIVDTTGTARSVINLDSSDNMLIAGRSGTTDITIGANQSIVSKSPGTVGFGTGTVDTASLTVGSSLTNGLVMYNTSDQVTNYEKVKLAFVSNEFTLLTQRGGTGLRRAISINGGTSGGGYSMQVENLPYNALKNPATSSSGSNLSTFGMHTSSSLSASSGVQWPWVFANVWNQSSTAGGYDVFINRTNTATGSGVQAYLAFATAGTLNSVFKVAGPWRNVPSSTQNLSAGTATLANARVVKVQGNGAAVTITAAPSIADGEEGDIIEIQGQSSSNTVTYQDQGTLASSNLRLGATTRLLGARDTLVLRYDGADWIEISFNNVL